MADPFTLTALSPREAITDALHRCLHGIDSNNRDLFESGFLKNESTTVIAGPNTIEGWTAVNELFGRLLVLVTTHVTSNIRIEMKDGADTASMSANAIAYHIRPDDALKPEDTSYTVASLYAVNLVKDSNDGLWKVKKWEIKVLWSTGDRAVLHG